MVNVNNQESLLNGGEEVHFPNGQFIHLSRIGYYRSSVIATDLTRSCVTYGYNHSSNGAFHYIFKFQKGAQGLYMGNCSYNIANFKNTTLASLTLALHSYNHVHTELVDDAIRRALLNLTGLLATGALGGYDLSQIDTLFSRFTMTFTCTRGGHSEALAQGNQILRGLQFFTWKVGPFCLRRLLKDPLGEVNDLARLILDMMDDTLDKHDRFGLSEDADNSDYPDFDTQAQAAESKGIEALRKFQKDMLMRRMDQVTFKFFPRNIREGTTHVLTPINYATKILEPSIRLDQLDPIPIGGNKDDVPADTRYFRLSNLYNDRTPGGQYRNLCSISTAEILATQGGATQVHYEPDVEADFNHLGFLKGFTEVRQHQDYLLQPAFEETRVKDNLIPVVPFIDPTIPDIHDVFFQPLGGDHVGCKIAPKDCVDAYFTRLANFWAAPYDQDDNHCFLRCLFRAHNKPESLEEFFKIRESLGMTKDEHFNLSNLQPLATINNEVYHVWNIVKANYESLKDHEELSETKISQLFKKNATFTPLGDTPQDKQKRKHVHFLWYKAHCYLIKDPKFVTDKVKCAKCTQWLKQGSFKSHYDKCNYCTICRKAYNKKKNRGHQCGGARLLPKENIARTRGLAVEKVCEDWVPTRKFHRVQKLTKESKIWLADIETFPDPHQSFNCSAYAIGVQCLEVGSKYYSFYGENCMADFLGMINS